MKTYLIHMNVEETLAKDAAMTLNGQVFPSGGKWPALLDRVSGFLTDKGFPQGIVVDAIEATAFVSQALQSDWWPSKDANQYVAIVLVDEPPTVEQWLKRYDDPSFRETLSREQAEKIFRTVLPADAIDYEQLAALLKEQHLHNPEDLLLLPNDTDVPGFDDISYLLKDVYWELGQPEFLSHLTNSDLRWLYERNRDTINRWMADQQIHLFELSIQNDCSEDLCHQLTQQWAKATFCTYAQLQRGGRK